MQGDLLVTGIGELTTPLGSAAPRGKEAMGRVSSVKDAAVLVLKGKIEYAGPASGLAAPPLQAAVAAAGPGLARLDSGGRAVVPGFVDSHTHFVFAGYRDDEFMWKAAGLPYMEIHKRGGGIARSVAATRAASKEELVALGAARLRTMLALGVTTVEGKSGYGLDLATELRQLEAMRDLEAARRPGAQGTEIVPTFLGPHSVPPEYAGRPGDYVDFVVAEVLPAVAERGLARFADIFCEKGVFGIEDSRRYLEAARGLGFGLKLHADEIERIGGAGLAAELGARSADHLLKASAEDLGRMAAAGVVAGCLPLTAFTLREPYADARGMIDAGLAVAIASDLNPGSCYSQSIPLAFALAVLYLRLSMEEALTALTLGGAASLGLEASKGSLEPGKDGDLLVLEAPSYRFLAYHAGMNLVRNVVKAGELVVGPAS
ncbi:MAG TPA: imidazolonepropionase [Spirochaetia bacterium]|nr:imidazolonepropionase [Spirochaetia bacterium]